MSAPVPSLFFLRANSRFAPRRKIYYERRWRFHRLASLRKTFAGLPLLAHLRQVPLSAPHLCGGGFPSPVPQGEAVVPWQTIASSLMLEQKRKAPREECFLSNLQDGTRSPPFLRGWHGIIRLASYACHVYHRKHYITPGKHLSSPFAHLLSRLSHSSPAISQGHSPLQNCELLYNTLNKTLILYNCSSFIKPPSPGALLSRF